MNYVVVTDSMGNTTAQVQTQVFGPSMNVDLATLPLAVLIKVCKHVSSCEDPEPFIRALGAKLSTVHSGAEYLDVLREELQFHETLGEIKRFEETASMAPMCAEAIEDYEKQESLLHSECVTSCGKFERGDCLGRRKDISYCKNE